MDDGRQIVDLEARLAELGGGGGYPDLVEEIDVPGTEIMLTSDATHRDPADGWFVGFKAPPNGAAHLETPSGATFIDVYDQGGMNSGLRSDDLARIASAGRVIISTEIGAIDMIGLPLVDPAVEGRLWNDAGVLKISAG